MNKLLIKNWIVITFVLVFLLAVFLRFYQLGTNPPSVDWDEASLGYNAYSILLTGSDEYGEFMPLSIRSFDDHKPPLYVYLTVPSIAIFGLNDYAVRLPSAVMGVVAVVATYFLVLELFSGSRFKENKKFPVELVALLSMFFMAVSPWSLQFSRAAFEGSIGLTFFILGTLFLLKALRKSWYLILSAVCFGLCIFSYHSFRLIVPIFLLTAFLLFYKTLLKNKLHMLVSIVIFILLLTPVFFSLFSGSGTGSRLSMVTIFGNPDSLKNSIERQVVDLEQGNPLGSVFHNRRVVYGLAATKAYLDHFNPDFLFIHGDGGRQHHAVDVGMLYLWELPFILLGIYFLIGRTDKRIGLLFAWFILAPLAAAFSTGTPHPVRAIAMIPPFHIFTAVGLVFLLYVILDLKRKFLKTAAIAFILLAFVFNFGYYLHQYYVHTPIEYGDFWQYGYKEVFETLKKEEGSVDKFIVTYVYDQPYVYYLYYNKVDPVWYQKNWDYQGNGQTERFRRVIGDYEFRNIKYHKDKVIPNAIIVGTPDEIPPDAPNIIKEILFPNGKVAFRLIRT